MPEVYVDPATDGSELAAAAKLRVALDRRRGLRSRDAVESLALLSPGSSNAQPPPDFVPKTGWKVARIEHRLPWRLPLLKAISWVALVVLGIFGPLIQLSHLTEIQIASTIALIIILVLASYPANPSRRFWTSGGPSRRDWMNPPHQDSAYASLADTAPASTQIRAIFSPPFAVGWWLGLVPFFLAWHFWLRTSFGSVFGAIVSAVVSVLLLTAAGLAAAWCSGSLREYRAWNTQLAPILGFAIGTNLIPDVVRAADTVAEGIAFVVAVFGTPFAHLASAAVTLTAWNQLENRGIEHRFLLALARHVAWALLLAGWNVATLVGHGYWQIAAGAVLIVMLYLLHRSWSRDQTGIGLTREHRPGPTTFGWARTGTIPVRATGPPVPRAVPSAVWTRPRTFYFLDNDRIRGVLGQIEDGRVVDITTQRANVVRRGLVTGVSANIPPPEGATGHEWTNQTLIYLDGTPEARFNLLHAYLTDNRQLRTFDPHAAFGTTPETKQYCETVVESRDIFHRDAGTEVELTGTRTTVVYRFTEDGRTSEYEVADGEVTVMGRVSSDRVVYGRHVLTIRVFAVYQ